MVVVPHLALSSTLQHVAQTKMTKLAQRHAEFEEFWREHVDGATDQYRDVDSVRRLLKAMKDAGHKFDDPTWPEDLELFLVQAENDPSIGSSRVAAWGQSLLSELKQKRARFEATSLFSTLVLEWIQNPLTGQSSMDESDSAIGQTELREQLHTWKSYAFEEKPTDKADILSYLQELFQGKQQASTLNETSFDHLRKAMAEFDEVSIDKDTIQTAINALLNEDLFAGEKRDALEDLKSRHIVLEEIADALRSDLSALDRWTWQSTPISIHLRKHINGRFRVYLDEEIYQAIFIQIVGSAWAVFLKRVLKTFATSPVWLKKSTASKISKEHIQKCAGFMGKSAELSRRTTATINVARWGNYYNVFLLSQLPSWMHTGTKGGYNDELNENTTSELSPSEIKQSMLRFITTEILVQKHIHGTATYFQTDFKWFGPSIPHITLLTLFKFFHVPSKWIAFFREFMQPTLQVEEEGGYSEPKKRVRGIPISHTLSTAFGELLLFVLDFAVNQATQGCNIYRFFDDIHFFGQPDSCATAWDTIQTFTRTMGLTLNEEKSGSFQCSLAGKETPLPSRLPVGQVHWGFLTLVGDGEWRLDQEKLSHHISEMARQLKYCDSILSFVQAYNTYMRFFVNNAGHHAECLGKKHAMSLIHMVLQVQKSVTETLSDSKHSDVISFLREKIQSRTDMKAMSSDVSDAFFFFPRELGGLGLYNPLESLSLKCRDMIENPENIILAVTERQKQEYKKALENFEAGNVYDIPPKASSAPLTFEDYVQFPEDTSQAWENVYKKLQSKHDESTFKLTDDMEMAKRRLKRNDNTDIPSQYSWVVQMYGAEVLDRMGRLAFGERDLMPLGLIKVLSKERVRWQA